MEIPYDRGPDFEQRAPAVARAIYDPSGTQGSQIFNGREHDGVFINEQAIVAFEFTTLRTKEKARKDAEKIRDILLHLSKLPEHRYKLFQGFFVTVQEPLADQRKVVDQVAANARVTIKCMSILTLRNMLINSEEYISKRLLAPFGSTGYKLSGVTMTKLISHYVQPTFSRTNGGAVSFAEVVQSVGSGERVVVTGDFGTGKSEALKRMFIELRRLYFKDSTSQRFPLHVNLRDCYGLRSAREVLRRHAEDIGFTQENSVVSAWRSGACTLLLDGFDELIPARWVGGARDLKQVRRQALEPVRRLVEETPEECGIVIAGRAQYFSNDGELLETLGLAGAAVHALEDLNDEQAHNLISRENYTLPSWVPRRALLLQFLLAKGLLPQLAAENVDVASAWLGILDLVAAREADRIPSLTPDSIRRLIARIATAARSSEDRLGPIAIDDMRSAFRDVCGHEADEEGLQLLLRLPGLATSSDSLHAVEPNVRQGDELRRFVDIDLADAAYGEDLAAYAAYPFVPHPLGDGVNWNSPAGQLSSGVAASALERDRFDSGVVSAVIRLRLDNSKFDAVLYDLCRVADVMSSPASSNLAFFSELLVKDLLLSGDDAHIAASTFKDCLIETLDVSDVSIGDPIPLFQDCIIANIAGWAQTPDEFSERFPGSEIINFSAGSETTSSLIQLKIRADDRVALVLLKKLYMQAGLGRRETALPRGLPLTDRARVQNVLSELQSAGYAEKQTHKGQPMWFPIRNRKSKVSGFLSTPLMFSLDLLSD